MYNIFILVIWFHFVEHVSQLVQLYVLHWPRVECLGLLGLIWPQLITSEWLHYGFALYMLIGLNYFLYKAQSKIWWRISADLQLFHHLEHVLLLTQALHNIPMVHRKSIGSFLMPRIELHFFYSIVILITLLLGMYYKQPYYSKQNEL